METKDLIIREIETIPEPCLEEILDYVRFLREKSSRRGMETAIMSQSVLSREWLRPEEDDAWGDL